MEAPRVALGGDEATTGEAQLRVRRAGLELSRSVKMRFGGVMRGQDDTRMGLQWEDARHPNFFPVLEAVMSLVPLAGAHTPITQIGLVGRYRPPLGQLGRIADRMAGEDLATEAVATFLDDVARRLESMIGAEPPPPVGLGPADPEGDSESRRILIPVDGLGERPGDAVALSRQLAATPGVVHGGVDPVTGMARIEYDPERCSLSRIVASLASDGILSPDPA